MTEPTLHQVVCPHPQGQHRMAYWQWGHVSAPHLVVCVHGLSRQGRDFDVMAQALVARSAGSLRVVCPDVVGRGRSDWLSDPMGYQIPQYAADMLTLLAQLQQAAPITTLDWIGTSMGGLIGMAICGQPGLPLPVPVRRLVLNDVGPVIEWSALSRIGEYVGKTGHFASIEAAADRMRVISESFGPHTPEQWLALSRPMLRALPQGGYTLHYDPALALPFRAVTPESSAQGEAALWQLYDAITARTLLLRGRESDLITPDTAQRMGARGPRAQCVEFAGVGHAPTLVADGQVAVVADFLLADGLCRP
jgi:pimeloyl-ACP methyl ester carboxylesterase